MCQTDPQETVQDTEPMVEGSSCVCQSFCEQLKQKLNNVDAKEVFDATMEGVRKRPLLGVLIAAGIGYFLGRLSKKFS